VNKQTIKKPVETCKSNLPELSHHALTMLGSFSMLIISGTDWRELKMYEINIRVE